MNKSSFNNIALLLLRLGFGGLMLTHGLPKLQKLLAGDLTFTDPIGVGEPASLILAVLSEAIFPILIIIGFKTRLSSIPVIITMAVAAFIVHANDPFAVKEKAILFLIGFIAIALLGPGKFSIDKK